MRIDPGLLIIILFIVAPLLERLLKAGKQQQKPPEQGPTAPRRRVPPPRPRPEQRPTSRAEAESEEETAAGMLPADLWAILTGQQPVERPRPEPPRAPQPPPVRTPEPAQARTPPPAQTRTPQPASVRTPPRKPTAERRFPEGGRSFELPEDEETLVRRTPPAAPFPVEGYVREIPTYRAPEIVSLEDLDIDEEKRHQRFHKRFVDASTPATVNRPARHELVNLLRQRAGVRRAVVLREVLGPPKGLE